jgi:hypothetical protein
MSTAIGVDGHLSGARPLRYMADEPDRKAQIEADILYIECGELVVRRSFIEDGG